MNGNPATTKDWTGTRVGKLTITTRGDFHVTKNGRTTKDRVWNALCDCGNHTTIKTSQITGTARTKRSCGCLMGKYDRGVTYAQKRLNDRWKELRQNAKRRGYIVDINKATATDLFQMPCHYCGAPYVEERPHGIDRAANSQGYFYGNCLPCCSICNHAKETLTGEEFFAWIERVRGRINEKDFTLDTHAFLARQMGVSGFAINREGEISTVNMLRDGHLQRLDKVVSSGPVTLVATGVTANSGLAMWLDEAGVHVGQINPPTNEKS